MVRYKSQVHDAALNYVFLRNLLMKLKTRDSGVIIENLFGHESLGLVHVIFCQVYCHGLT